MWYPREGTVSGGARRLHGAHSNHVTEARWGRWVPGAKDRRHWQRFLLVSSAAPEGPPCPSQSARRRNTNHHPNSVTNMSLPRPTQPIPVPTLHSQPDAHSMPVLPAVPGRYRGDQTSWCVCSGGEEGESRRQPHNPPGLTPHTHTSSGNSEFLSWFNPSLPDLAPLASLLQK